MHHTKSPVMLLLLISIRLTQGKQHNSSGNIPLRLLLDKSILTTCRSDDTVLSQMLVVLPPVVVLVLDCVVVVTTVVVLIVLSLLLVELLHCTPYHINDNNDDGDDDNISLAGHGFVVDIQLVFSFQVVTPLVDK